MIPGMKLVSVSCQEHNGYYSCSFLWTNDLILHSDSVNRLQKQLNGLFRFYSDGMVIANARKTNVMVYGPANQQKRFF